MENHTQKFKFRLGLFVIGGFALFVLAIFIIGKQKNMFNPVFKLTSTFSNVSGLQVGNNVRFSGINVGTVDNIVILNDTTVRVDLTIKKDVWQFVKSDCKVTLGSEGIIGDKLIIIMPGSQDAPLVTEGQCLETIETIETSAIMARLDATTANAENISKQISEITYNINNGDGTLSRLVHDRKLAEDLSQTVANLNRFSKGLSGTELMISSLKKTAGNSEIISQQLIATMNKINRGEGTLGRLIQDTLMAENFNQILIDIKKTTKDLSGMDTTLVKLKTTIGNAEVISQQFTEMMSKINKGNGTIGRLIRDTTFAENLNQTLINLKQGSKGLDENMTAAKHNFFFRGYFDRKAKAAKEKEEAKLKAEEEMYKK